MAVLLVTELTGNLGNHAILYREFYFFGTICREIFVFRILTVNINLVRLSIRRIKFVSTHAQCNACRGFDFASLNHYFFYNTGAVIIDFDNQPTFEDSFFVIGINYFTTKIFGLLQAGEPHWQKPLQLPPAAYQKPEQIISY